jgi:hypothetical protein
VTLNVGYTGNLKCAVFADSNNAPGAIAQSATAPLVNPIAGPNTFSFSPAIVLTKGARYWLGFMSDSAVTSGWLVSNDNYYQSAVSGSAVSYAAFPVASPVVSTGQSPPSCALMITPSDNETVVADQQTDHTGVLTDGTVNDADFYAISAAASTPASVIMVTTRGLFAKSDTTARSAGVQLKSGASTVQAAPALPAAAWDWAYRNDMVDPATGAAWTVAAVNSIQIGPVLTA